MTLLQRDKILELIKEKALIIESTDERVPFVVEGQISSDTVDLRLHPRGLVFKDNFEFADTLSDSPAEYFEAVNLPLSGYILKPGQILFGSTLEIVCINGEYIGRISSRGTYARFGLSVTCGRMRFPSGTPHTPDIQIVNHSPVPVKIYPYSFMLQLQIETIQGTPEPYSGMYPKTIGPVLPTLSMKDESVSKLLVHLSSVARTPTVNQENANKIVEQISSSVKIEKKPLIHISMSNKTRAILGILAGALSTLSGGFLVNMLSQGDWSYWKYISVAFSFLLTLLILFLGIVIVIGSETE